MMLQIERAGLEDVQAFAEVSALAGQWSESALRQAFLCPSSEAWVARLNTQLVGCALISFVLDEATLLLLAVRPEARRLGVGRRLLVAAEKSVQGLGIRKVHLEVRSRNHGARAFYGVHGYLEAGTRLRYYENDGDDAVLMTHDHLSG